MMLTLKFKRASISPSRLAGRGSDKHGVEEEREREKTRTRLGEGGKYAKAYKELRNWPLTNPVAILCAETNEIVARQKKKTKRG